MTPSLRPATDADSPRIAQIVAACYAAHAGCVFDLDGELPALKRVASHYARLGGAMLVAERRERVLGSVAWKPAPGNARELQLLYVDPAEQGAGIGRQLLEAAIEAAKGGGGAAIELWTDTRFAAAHRLYQARGFRRGAMTRSLGDKSHSVEFFYRLALAQRGTE